jgi:hypothetical protein
MLCQFYVYDVQFPYVQFVATVQLKSYLVPNLVYTTASTFLLQQLNNSVTAVIEYKTEIELVSPE